ncbi:MAG: hypothetical protein COA78_22695 [Blastopirellula sp.]|nr:MAG: hypothetical protein COA78_22695 [Blastopirellula sp.]
MAHRCNIYWRITHCESLLLKTHQVFWQPSLRPMLKNFLEHILNSVCDQLNCLADFSPDSLVVHTVRVKNYPCTIIEMPDPNPESAEAYFVALVILLNPDEQPPNDPTLAPARYFTLERGVSVRIDDPPRTVLAEWSKDGHANFGDGPEPTVEHFAHSIVQLIS